MKFQYRRSVVLFNYCFLLVLSRRKGGEGVFLNLFMTNPVHVEADAVAESIGREERRSLDHSGEQDDTIRHHPKDTRSPAVIDNDRSARLGGSHSNCNEDRECQIGMYCDRHYGLCKQYRTMGQLCRRDSQCAIGYDCMFGRCLVASKPGHRGARCSTDRDCLSGLCCARQHGEKICKPKLKLGQNCFVPDGGLPYWGNDMCPCEEGLICRYDTPLEKPSSTLAPLVDSTRESRSTISDDWFNLWTDQNQMRCVQS